MTFRIDPAKYPGRCKVQFTTAAWMPYLCYQACLEADVCSNTVYVQRAVCEALSRDLGLDLEELLDQLPEPRTRSKELRAHPRDPSVGRLASVVMVGPANTVEEVR
jgi:hypothetical protein